ncbi:MAG TPA: response regulator [Polyangia bacterium]|jgi:two-component system cell cycle response regulator
MSLKILLVEDNLLNQELARDLLEAAGHVVDLAVDGAGVRKVAGEKAAAPDIVLMDVLLPGADGVTLLGELRAVDRFAGVPIIAVTAQALAGDMQRFVAAGFDAVLTKPIDTRTFVADVERYAVSRGKGEGNGEASDRR